MPTDGQLISLMSHTIGSIGQVLKDNKNNTLSKDDEVKEIQRIYNGYIAIVQKWS